MEITQRLKEIIKQETNTNIDIRTRNRQTIEMRSLYCNILKELKPNKTLQSIGDTLDLNHATIIHALKNYKMYEDYNPELKKFKETILSYFESKDKVLKQLTASEQLNQKILLLKIENDSLRIQLKQQVEKPRYEYTIIENLNNLLESTKGTEQYNLIILRLEAFYTMNKNVRL